MIGNNFQVRRATLDDLTGIRRLWQQACLPAKELEKRFTEFQVVETPDGDLLGCAGLQIDGLHGCIHSQGIRTPELEPELSQRLWERIQSVARNHGLVRLWTREPSPFWASQGFRPAGEEIRKQAPAPIGPSEGEWQTLQLRELPAQLSALDQEFELFKQSQKSLTSRAFKHAAILRAAAALAALIGLGLTIFACWYVLTHLPPGTKP